MKRCILLISMLVMSTATPGRAQEPISILLERGIHAEETKGDLEAAIAAFSLVLEVHEKSREATATALIHLAECERKLGNLEAARAHLNRVLDAFGDIAGPAAQALALTLDDAGDRVPTHGHQAWIDFDSAERGEGPRLVYLHDNSMKISLCDGDAVVISYLAENNYGSHGSLSVSVADTNRAFIQFTLPSEVSRAALSMPYVPSTLPLREAVWVLICPVLSTWDPESLTWNNQPEIDRSRAVRAVVRPGSGTASANITSIVDAWNADEIAPNGVAVVIESPWFGPPPFENTGGTQFSGEEISGWSMGQLFEAMLHDRVGYAHYAGLWALAARGKKTEGDRDAILERAGALVNDQAAWGRARWLAAYLLGALGDARLPDALEDALAQGAEPTLLEGLVGATGMLIGQDHPAADEARAVLEKVVAATTNGRVRARAEEALRGDIQMDPALLAEGQASPLNGEEAEMPKVGNSLLEN